MNMLGISDFTFLLNASFIYIPAKIFRNDDPAQDLGLSINIRNISNQLGSSSMVNGNTKGFWMFIPQRSSNICININVTLTPATAKGYSHVALLPPFLHNNCWNVFWFIYHNQLAEKTSHHIQSTMYVRHCLLLTNIGMNRALILIFETNHRKRKQWSIKMWPGLQIRAPKFSLV